MQSSFFHITPAGLVFYSLFVLGAAYIITKKEHKLISIIFPFFALVEGLFIDWRWGKIDNFEGVTLIIVGSLPSFLIALCLPFMWFFLHYLLPQAVKVYLRESNSFPFSNQKEYSPSDFNRYYQRGFLYSVGVLFLNEITQTLHISSRNTFDIYDIVAIIIGSIFSFILYKIVVGK